MDVNPRNNADFTLLFLNFAFWNEYLKKITENKEAVMTTVSLIVQLILAFATVGLMVFTCTLWRATNKYRKATEDMAEIQEKVLKVNRADLIRQSLEASKTALPIDSTTVEELNLQAKFKMLLQNIIKDIEVEQQD